MPFLSPVPEVHDLEDELHDVIDWIPFGFYLGIRLPKLKSVEANYPTLQRRRIEMLEEWQNNATPTWSAVIEALVGIGMRRLASELTQKYGWLNSDCYHNILYYSAFAMSFNSGAPPLKLPDNKPLNQLENILQQEQVG